MFRTYQCGEEGHLGLTEVGKQIREGLSQIVSVEDDPGKERREEHSKQKERCMHRHAGENHCGCVGKPRRPVRLEPGGQGPNHTRLVGQGRGGIGSLDFILHVKRSSCRVEGR